MDKPNFISESGGYENDSTKGNIMKLDLLSDCPICGGFISKNTKNCPKCGEPDPFRIYQRERERVEG